MAMTFDIVRVPNIACPTPISKEYSNTNIRRGSTVEEEQHFVECGGSGGRGELEEDLDCEDEGAREDNLEGVAHLWIGRC